MNGQLSRTFEETLGVKQGHIKSLDNFKIYINSLLDMIDSANLGMWLGPVNVGSSACADDEYLITDSQSKLQSLLDIAAFTETKVTVVGSAADMQYYGDVSPWQMDWQTVTVAVDNDHLDQVVSGRAQEQKNLDLKKEKSRNNLF